MSIIEKALQKSAARKPRPAPVDNSPELPASPPPSESGSVHPDAHGPEPLSTSSLVDFGPDDLGPHDLASVTDVHEQLIEERTDAPEPGGEPRSDAGEQPASPRSDVATPPPAAPRTNAPGAMGLARDDGYAGQSIEIDFKKLATMGLITPDTLDSETAEQHRIIKRPLLRKVAEGSGQAGVYNNLILVTSSVPGEGKTFTSVNLAISMAMELDHTVLLVDTDVARSGVAEILGINYEHGLTDYLRNEETDLSKLLVRTNVRNLTVLPVGKSYPNTTELLSSKEMLRLRDELATRYSDRIVIFDSPPLLAVTGTSVLTEIVGQIVLVVEAVRTSKGALRDALRLLANVPESHIGIVLNKSRETSRKSYRYGYYGNESGAQR